MAFTQYRGFGTSSGINARIIPGNNLEYTSLAEKVFPGAEERPLLIETMIHEKNVAINVMDGFDSNMAAAINQHSIYHLYEYEAKTGFLDDIPRPIIGDNQMRSKFLCCRYVICGIDEWMTHKKSIELLAIKKNGDIYIGMNKSSENDYSDITNAAAFGGLNFAKKVTIQPSAPNFEKLHSVVKQWRIENKRSHKVMDVFISSVARAFDADGNVVEIKTVGSRVMGKIQNLPGAKARGWWLRALLSGATRIVYGLRMNNMMVNEILEANIDEFTHGHFQFSESRLFGEVFKVFEKIDRTLQKNDEMCLVHLNMYQRMEVELTTDESLKRSPFW